MRDYNANKTFGPLHWYDNNSCLIEGRYGPVTLDHKSAVALRDALLEAYPVEENSDTDWSWPEVWEEAVEISPYSYGVDLIEEPSEFALDVDPYPEPWQLVSCDPRGAGHTYRHRVPGGWLYRTVTYRYPDEHRLYEEMANGENPDWELDGQPASEGHNDVEREWLYRAQEVLTQTTIFVPEA